MSNLTPDERARIVEEEKLRQNVRRNEAATANTPVALGCGTLGALFGLLGLITPMQAVPGLLIGLIIAAFVGSSRGWFARGGAGWFRFAITALSVSAFLYWPIGMAFGKL